MGNRTYALTAGLSLFAATPALAAGGGISLTNTDFVVFLGLVVFLAILAYYKVPSMIAKMLDERASGIESDLNEARSLRDEAQSLLASYERKHREVQEQADRIVSAAKRDADAAAEQAREDLDASIKRRMAAAEDQIANARTAAIKEVKDQSVVVAVAAARDVIAKQMTDADSASMIDRSIEEVQQKLH